MKSLNQLQKAILFGIALGLVFTVGGYFHSRTEVIDYTEANEIEAERTIYGYPIGYRFVEQRGGLVVADDPEYYILIGNFLFFTVLGFSFAASYLALSDRR